MDVTLQLRFVGDDKACAIVRGSEALRLWIACTDKLEKPDGPPVIYLGLEIRAYSAQEKPWRNIA